jgi:hypothetical protein
MDLSWLEAWLCLGLYLIETWLDVLLYVLATNAFKYESSTHCCGHTHCGVLELGNAITGQCVSQTSTVSFGFGYIWYCSLDVAALKCFFLCCARLSVCASLELCLFWIWPALNCVFCVFWIHLVLLSASWQSWIASPCVWVHMVWLSVSGSLEMCVLCI